ncbi:MAG: biotin--[acetyl-CoA-carboxylase] ligase [Armatimonadetes bacterium]|nr:biotin--[acetyl-CoA-carboxylase] ligase [Armatimonadota bacterium]
MLDVTAVRAHPEDYWRILWHEEVSSTNDLVAGAAALGAKEGLVIGAETQTAGRGRWGRQWLDAPGRCLLFSALVTMPRNESQGLVGMAAALAVLCAVRDAGAPAVGFRWPNDVTVARRKVAGILVEAVSGAAVVGVGVNVRGRAEEFATGCGAVTVEEAADHPVSREELLGSILTHLHDVMALLRAGRGQDVLSALAEADDLSNRRVTVASSAGEFIGVGAGMDACGRLLVETPQGMVALSQGEVVRVGD